MQTEARLKFPSALGITLASLIATIPIILFTTGMPRIILVTLVQAFLLGHIALLAFLPRGSGVDAIERLGLSVAFSPVVSFLMALALNVSPWGLRSNTILIAMVTYFVLMAIIISARNRRALTGEQYRILLHTGVLRVRRLWAERSRNEKVVSVAILALVAVTLTYAALSPTFPQTFTEFYILNDQGNARYPSTLYVGDEAKLKIHVVNNENQLTTYRLVVMIQGQEVKQIQNIRLGQGDEWQETIGVRPRQASPDQKVEFLLYKNDDKETYQRLHLWVDVVER